MSHTHTIRYRFVTLLILGGAISVLSLFGLVRALGLAESQRLQRARDAVAAELDVLADSAPSPELLASPPPSTYVGLRGGWAPRGDRPPISVPAAWREPLAKVLAEADRSASVAAAEIQLGTSTLLLAARPAVSPAAQSLAWTGLVVGPSTVLKPWRWITIALVVLTGLLVATTVIHIVTFRNSTRAVKEALGGLAHDLETPVPRVGVRELAEIAEGIAKLAQDLAAARDARERLSTELAHKERLAALGRVVAGVAHEVRNPLASIKLRLDLAAANHALPATARTSVEAASSEIARLDRLVSDLLVVAGKKLGPAQPLELGALVRARVENLAPWAEQKGVSVRAEGAGGAEADPESLARALDNLLRNAVEAAPSGTQVLARVTPAERGIAVAVEDHGVGVAPAREGELFEPFFSTKAGGTGLGLAVSRAIARAHGGDLRYLREGEVTRFTLVVPAGEAVEVAS